MKQQAVFKALADPTRRGILRRLQSGSATARPSLTHHFNVLREAGLIRNERRGQHIVYSLNTTVFEETAGMLFELFGHISKRGKKGRKK